MKILVIAAHGKTGSAVVREALLRGHKVRALVRDTTTHTTLDPRAELFIGDATLYPAILQATKGVDVVISAIGHVASSNPRVQELAMKNLVRAAQMTPFKIISLTGTGVRQPGDTPSFIDKVMTLAITTIDPARVKDGIAHAKVLQQSSTTWSILRVLKLTNKNALQPFGFSAHGPVQIFSSRSQVASALVILAETTKWNGKMPILIAN